MNVLLDTHALFWFINGHSRFSSRARNIIEADETTVYVSAATGWEIATKVRLGKWPEASELAETLSEVVAQFTFLALPITLEHGRIAGLLPAQHRDPFDRMLAAQCLLEGIPLVTADPVFRELGTQVIW